MKSWISGCDSRDEVQMEGLPSQSNLLLLPALIVFLPMEKSILCQKHIWDGVLRDLIRVPC